MIDAVTVVVTEREYIKGRAVFESGRFAPFHFINTPPEESAVTDAINEHRARHAIVGDVTYRDALYDALEAGAVLARFGIGYDGIDLERATERRLICTNTPGILFDPVAEFTIMLMLSAARKIATLFDNAWHGVWTPQLGTELRGKRLAVIGCGSIGNRVTEIASRGFGMDVVGCEPGDVDADALKRAHGYSRVVGKFEEAVHESDFVSLHIPNSDENQGFVNIERLRLMPERSWLINTARGAVIDEAALYDALNAGVIAGAALDVYINEPYRPLKPGCDLRDLPNVIMTPHAASSTVEGNTRMAEAAVRNVLSGHRRDYDAMNIVNPSVLKLL